MDSRVDKLAAHWNSIDHWKPPLPNPFWPNQARLKIEDIEAAGLVVIDPDNEAAVERVAVLLHDGCTEPTGASWEAMLVYEPVAAAEYRQLACAILAALRGGA